MEREWTRYNEQESFPGSLMSTKRVINTLWFVLAFAAACNSQKGTTNSAAVVDAAKSPFSLSIVPQTNYEEPFGSSIEMAPKAREFFVVLTNVSSQTQPVWEYWNSWGYQTVSFEVTTADGKKFALSRRQENFTMNWSTTFLVGPGEHQVYAIRLDDQWETHPSLPKANEIPITLKAIYEVSPTEEAAQSRVWIGHLESRIYKLKLRRW